MRHHWLPRGLQGRTVLAFGAVALGLAAVVASTVWLVVTSYLIGERREDAVTQTYANARRLENAVAGGALPVRDLLAQLRRERGSVSILRFAGSWYTTSLSVGPGVLPPTFRDTVLDGQPAWQHIGVDGGVRLAVGVPIGSGTGGYIEVFPLDDLDNAYDVLRAALAVSVLAAPLVGMLLGSWTVRPVLRPLHALSGAAAAMAGGDLDARIDSRGDPYLEPLATSFNRTADALKERVRADALFAADVSHELRSPLTTMSAAAGLLAAHRARLPEDGAEALDLLRAEVSRFERLVTDLLEISRADAGSTDVVLADVRLAELVAHCLPAVHRDRLRIGAGGADVAVRADKRRLDRVLANLVENAERHGRGLIAVTVEGDGDAGCLVVDDGGPGVPEDARQRIFDRFARASPEARRSGEGAGLGLALVRRHVTLMGGAVEATASPAGGARFVVRLPAQRGSS